MNEGATVISMRDFSEYYRRLASRSSGGPSTEEAQRDYRSAVGQILWVFQRSF